MIVTETRTKNGKQYKCTYSDAGMMIAYGVNQYCIAYDPADSSREYAETEIAIAKVALSNSAEVDADTAAYAEAGRILMGVSE